MSITPYFYIEACDSKTRKWEKVEVFTFNKKRNEYVPVRVWDWNGTHDLFDILGLERGYVENSFDTHAGFPADCSEEIRNIYDEIYGDFSYKPEVEWFNLADAKLYVKRVPKVVDYDEEVEVDENGKDIFSYKDNPMVALIDRVTEILNVWDDFWSFLYFPSDIRVICWVS